MPWLRRRGRILAVKWGYNPNSSSLGVDVTFLLFGMAAIALLTPIVSLFLRSRRAKRNAGPGTTPPPAGSAPSVPEGATGARVAWLPSLVVRVRSGRLRH